MALSEAARAQGQFQAVQSLVFPLRSPYTKLEMLKLKCGLGHFRLKAQLYAIGLKAMYQQLRLLRA